MEVENASVAGSLQISTDVVAKIAKLATLEVEGVHEVSAGKTSTRNLLGKVSLQKPIAVQMTDDVAEITVNIVVDFGCKIPGVCEQVQNNVKNAVQNMTSITVSKVNLVVAGVAVEEPAAEEEE